MFRLQVLQAASSERDFLYDSCVLLREGDVSDHKSLGQVKLGTTLLK